MPFDEVELGEIALAGDAGLVDGPFGSNLPASDYVPYGVPVIRGSNLSKGEVRFKGEDFVFVSDATADRLNRSTCIPRDIIFTKKGTLGQVGIVPTRPYEKYLLSSNQMRLRVNEAVANSDYVYYALSTYDSISKIIREAEHTGVPKINLAYIRRFRIPLPPRSVQDQICGIISALDNRIDVLRQTNATLESVAQALFKSWFIDFDPVRAKAEGREPDGMDAATAALFPTEFEESALGLIPRGWSVARLGDTIELAYGKALKATDRRPGSVPVYGSGGITGYHDEALVKHASIVVGRKGTVGALYWEDAPFFPIDTTFYVKPKMTPLTFCFYAMQRLGLTHMNTDAAVPGLNRENAYRLEVLRPVGEVLEAFDQLVGPLREAMRTNGLRADTLMQLRDSLLPRLISGKLRLPEAQAQLEEVIA